MSISVSDSFMNYAKAMEGTSLKGYSALSPMVLRSKAGKSNTATNSSAKSNKNEDGSIEGVRNNSGTVSSNAEKKVVKRNSGMF